MKIVEQSKPRGLIEHLETFEGIWFSPEKEIEKFDLKIPKC